MAHLELDLNLEPPGLDLNKPPELDQENVEPPELNQMPWIDWSAIGEWDGPAHELDYHMVWDEGTFMFSSLEKSISVWLGSISGACSTWQDGGGHDELGQSIGAGLAAKDFAHDSLGILAWGEVITLAHHWAREQVSGSSAQRRALASHGAVVRSSGAEQRGVGNGARTGVDSSHQVARGVREPCRHIGRRLVALVATVGLAGHMAAKRWRSRRQW